MQLSRRRFLKGAAAAATPFLLPSRIWAAKIKPNSRLTLGFVGTGMQGRGLLGGFLGMETEVLAVCDVDASRRNEANRLVAEHYAGQGRPGAKCDVGSDFRKVVDRKDIDAVVIATPDHWHALVALAALRSGKDVYCEKPLTHTIDEAVRLIRAVDANNRVLQTGSMQRSMQEFRVACELVRNGAIGKIERVKCAFGGPPRPCNLPKEPMEPGLDWDRWLGPAPWRDYNSVLSPRGIHNTCPWWRMYSEYGGGMVCDWGDHHLNIAQWGLGMDDSGPVAVLPPKQRGGERGATLVYANGVTVEHKDGFGIDFFGSEGEVQVNRNQFTFRRGKELIASFTNQPHAKTSCAAEVLKAQPASSATPRSSCRRARITSGTSLNASARGKSRSPASRSADVRPSAATW